MLPSPEAVVVVFPVDLWEWVLVLQVLCEWASLLGMSLSVNTTSRGNDLHVSSFFVRTPLKLIHWLLFWLLKGLAQLKLGFLNQPENLFSYLPALDLKLEESIQRTYWGFRIMVTLGGWGRLCNKKTMTMKDKQLDSVYIAHSFGLSIYSSPVYKSNYT